MRRTHARTSAESRPARFARCGGGRSGTAGLARRNGVGLEPGRPGDDRGHRSASGHPKAGDSTSRHGITGAHESGCRLPSRAHDAPATDDVARAYRPRRRSGHHPEPTPRTGSRHRSPTRSSPRCHRRGRTPPTMSICHNSIARGSFPPLVVRPLPFPSLRSDQPVTDQTTLHRRPPRQRTHPRPVQPERDRARPPPRMRPTHLHGPRLELRAPSDADTTGAVSCDRPTRPTLGPRTGATTHAPSDAPPRPTSDVDDRRTVVEDLQHRLIALLHQVQLHQHDSGVLRIYGRDTHSEEGGHRNTDPPVSPTYQGHSRPETGAASPNRQPATGATMSTINRVRTHAGPQELLTNRGQIDTSASLDSRRKAR